MFKKITIYHFACVIIIQIIFIDTIVGLFFLRKIITNEDNIYQPAALEYSTSAPKIRSSIEEYFKELIPEWSKEKYFKLPDDSQK